MKRTLILVCSVVCLSTVAVAQPKPLSKTIDASLLFRPERTKIIGGLKSPLGTVVRITGVCIDGTQTRISEYKGKLLLDIETVDDVHMDKLPLYIHPAQLGAEQLPGVGDTFDYFVHECGEFSGQVDLPPGIGPAGPEESVGHFGFKLRLKIHPPIHPKQTPTE